MTSPLFEPQRRTSSSTPRDFHARPVLLSRRKREGLRRKNLQLDVTSDARALLATLGWHPQYGARPLKRTIEERVMMPLAVQLSKNPKLRDKRVSVRRDGDELRVEIK